MTPNSAWTLEPIVAGQSYAPQPIFENIGGNQVQKGETPPVYALLCTKGGTAGNVQIKTLGGTTVTLPSTTFKQGVVYYMYLDTLVDDNGGDVVFVGMKYRNAPLVF